MVAATTYQHMVLPMMLTSAIDSLDRLLLVCADVLPEAEAQELQDALTHLRRMREVL